MWQLRAAGSRGHPTTCVICVLVLPFTFPALTTHLVVALKAKEHPHSARRDPKAEVGEASRELQPTLVKSPAGPWPE